MERYIAGKNIRLDRHTEKNETGGVTTNGCIMIEEKVLDELKSSPPDDKMTFVFDTSKARTMFTAQLIIELWKIHGYGHNIMYCGEATELDEGAIDDYIPELVTWLRNQFPSHFKIEGDAERIVDRIWFPFWVAVDESVFNQFSKTIKTGKQVVRESAGWILKHLLNQDDYNIHAITHGPVLGALLHAIGNEVDKPILPLTSTDIGSLFKKELDYLASINIFQSYSNPLMTTVTFNNKSYSVPILTFEMLSERY